MRNAIVFGLAVCVLGFGVVYGSGGVLPGGGTESSPYLIEDLDDFLEFADNSSYWAVGVHVKLMCDIDLTGQSYDTAVISPDTSPDFMFQGTAYRGAFDGNWKVVRNVNIDTEGATKDFLGLFGIVYFAEVKNLGLENASITAGDDSRYIGVLSGSNSFGDINNCYSSGAISCGDGLQYIGGIVGRNYETVSGCYSSVSITSTGNVFYVGGLIGFQSGTVVNSYSTGPVNIGGNAITVGGFCGYNSGTVSKCYSLGSIADSQATSSLGPFCGDTDNVDSVNDCYYYLHSGISNNIGTVLDDVEIQDASSFLGFDFAGNSQDGTDEVWDIVSGHCPKLSWQIDDGPVLTPNTPTTTLLGLGTSGDPFQINNFADFTEFCTNSELDRGYFILNTDIDLSGQTYVTAVINRIFGGHLDGNGHTVQNILIDTSGQNNSYLGLFSTIVGSVRKLGVENISIIGGDGSERIGGLCGYNKGIVSECYSTGSISGGSYLGGLCGYNNDGTINDSYSSVDVVGGWSGSSLGGLCGYNNGGGISDCYSIGSVEGSVASSFVGGLCGQNTGTVEDSYFYLLCGPDNGFGEALGEIQLQDASNFTGFDFVNRWHIISGHCPNLSWQSLAGPLSPSGPVTTLSGSGYSNDPFEINSLADFNEFVSNSALRCGYYVLSSDIDLGGTSYGRSVIGGVFGGHFDGSDNIVSNMAIDVEGSGIENLGLFGIVAGSVSNLGLENAKVAGGNSSNYIGILCGENIGDIDDCYSSGVVSGGEDSEYIGGLCGYNNYGTISSCDSTGWVNSYGSSSYIGGLCGRNDGGSILDSSASSTVRSRIGNDAKYIGGLCGYNDAGVISGCNSSGSVYGARHSREVGGLCGTNDDGTIINSYSSSSIECDVANNDMGGLCGKNYGTISSCFSTGHVSLGSSGYDCGGLCGDNHGVINNCYSNSEIQCVPDYLIFGYGGLCGVNHGDINNCYSTGLIKPNLNPSNYGGLCGEIISNGVINKSFWNIETSGTTIGYTLDENLPGTANYVVGKTTAEMQIQSTFTYAPFLWDFVEWYDDDSDWYMPAGDYPRLTFGRAFNGDVAGHYGIDFEDLSYLAEYWGSDDCGGIDDCGRADIDDSSEVGFGDVATVAANWLAGVVSPEFPTVFQMPQAPFSGINISLPGFVQAEDYDLGGTGISYYDTSGGNEVGYYRSDDVDIANFSNNFNVGWTKDGEWLEYTVDVAGGLYNIEANFAALEAGGQLRVKLGDVTLCTFDVPKTGNWQSYDTVKIYNIELSGGKDQVLRFEIVGGDFNIDWVRFDKLQSPYGSSAISLPGTVEAEDYDYGGQNVAYYDTTAGNEVGEYRGDDVDIAARDGGYVVSWTEGGEWLEYTVDIVGGVYDMRGRFATTEAGKQLRVLLDGVELGVFDVPVTGDWGVYETVSLGGVTLPDGDGQVLRLEIIGGWFNLNWIAFEP